MAKHKQDIQYRYYEMPPDSHVLALLGAGWIRAYGSDLDALHFHNHLEIGYCHGGCGIMEYGDDEHPFKAGSFTVIPPNFLHNTMSASGTKSRWEYLFIDAKSFLEERSPDRPDRVTRGLRRIYSSALLLNHDTHPALAELVLGIMAEQRGQDEFYRQATHGLLDALLVHVARIHPKPREHGEVDSGHIFALQPALDYAGAHYREKVMISDMAEACHLSETHFRRRFTETMRMPPLAYLNLVRIEQACRLLHTTQESIQDIAVQAGFSTITSFNRNFKDVTGVTPLQWRRDTAYHQTQLERQGVMVYEGWR